MELPLLLENILLLGAVLGLGFWGIYLLTRPLKLLLSWFCNVIAGIVALFVLSLIGPEFGAVIPLNFFTIAVAALLGLPGVALILLKTLFF